MKGCARHSVCFLSFVTWLLGGTLIGCMMWVLATSTAVHRFFKGTLIFTYVVLILGSFLFLNGLLGWIGSYRRGSCLLKLFLIFSLLTISCEIGGIIALNIMKMKMTDILQTAWMEINQNTRNVIQEHFVCCGFVGPQEFADTNDPIDDSCYYKVLEGQNISVVGLRQLNRIGCKEKLVDWFYTNKAIWITCLGALLLLQVISILLAVLVINQMKRENRSSQDINESHHTYL
ncbi:tetraspanin-9-like isoform X1 [Centruroides vittatus]|uniref:tetraspanin-9-like isoform X1 n=2 Tax=Centruroides sculpturatus TaxID=218467 RepID=UPI000C6D7290|nr:tetraspanin-9-like isoform X1 [Centruroides sculpturatus]